MFGRFDTRLEEQEEDRRRQQRMEELEQEFNQLLEQELNELGYENIVSSVLARKTYYHEPDNNKAANYIKRPSLQLKNSESTYWKTLLVGIVVVFVFSCFRAQL